MVNMLFWLNLESHMTYVHLPRCVPGEEPGVRQRLFIVQSRNIASRFLSYFDILEFYDVLEFYDLLQ